MASNFQERISPEVRFLMRGAFRHHGNTMEVAMKSYHSDENDNRLIDFQTVWELLFGAAVVGSLVVTAVSLAQ